MLTAEAGYHLEMGVAIWIGCGIVAFLVARIVPNGRGARRMGELSASVAVALALGALATALDFGGWNELDWRASLLALLGGFAAAGFVRAMRLASRRAEG